MKYSLGVSTLLAASVVATYVDASDEPIYRARNLQIDSHLQVRNTDDLFTIILRRSPKGGDPSGSGDSILRAQSPPRPSPKSSQGEDAKGKSGVAAGGSSKQQSSSVARPQEQRTQKGEMMSKASSPRLRESPSLGLPPKSPSRSPIKGSSSSRGGAGSSKAGSPKAGSSLPGQIGSSTNPFTAAAKSPLNPMSANIFPKLGTRFEGTGTLEPQSRRKPMISGRGSPGTNIGRAPFGGSSQGSSGRGRGTVSQGRALHEGWTAVGRPRIPPTLPSASGTRRISREGTSAEPSMSGGRGKGSSERGGETASSRDTGAGVERRSIEDEEIPTHFARSLDDWHTNDIYIRSLVDIGSLWERSIAGREASLKARSPPVKIKTGSPTNGNPTGIRTGGVAKSSSDTRTPSRGNSPAAESPRHMQPTTTPPPPPQRSLESNPGNVAAGRAAQSPGIGRGWPLPIPSPRSILRQDSANDGRNRRRVSFASPIETQILSSGPDFSRSSSMDSLGSIDLPNGI